MSNDVSQFVFGALDAWGGTVTDLAPGVKRVQLPEGTDGLAAWYLSRPTGELMLTTDLDRWEEGSRLECVTLSSPLVRRLQQYVEARGVIATATAEPDPKVIDPAAHRYHCYLICRFSARFESVTITEDRRWLGVSLSSGKQVRVSGDPMTAPRLRESAPKPYAQIEPTIDVIGAVDVLTNAWEAEIATRAVAFGIEAEKGYRSEAEDATRVYSGEELAARLALLANRYAPKVETQLESAVRLWR